ncbi:MAG TPA: M20 family metallopeptidase [Candidatus Limnocylindria bacterium]
MEPQRLKERASARIDERAADLDELALRIHDRPEIAFEERFASGALADYLAVRGHRVSRATGGIETAFCAEAGGAAGPVVAILAEYDALPGLGHACGHNLIATAAVGAFLGTAAVAGDLRGTVRLLGTPAEEKGAGKARLLAAGVFAGVDAALMFHPADVDLIDPPMLALAVVRIEMQGKAAHAAAAPSEGVNALDGLLLGWTALSALRQLVRSDARIHGIITDGGQAPNIIPEHAAATVIVRAADAAYVAELRRRVLACFEGAARATGCELLHEWEEQMDPVTTNPAIAAAFVDNARVLGRSLRPRRTGELGASTDMGNVSAVIPSIHPLLSITETAVPWHSHDFAAAARSPRGLETMHVAAKALAFTAIDLLARPQLLREAKESFAARRRPPV